jgi:hypothetical protein
MTKYFFETNATDDFPRLDAAADVLYFTLARQRGSRLMFRLGSFTLRPVHPNARKTHLSYGHFPQCMPGS